MVVLCRRRRGSGLFKDSGNSLECDGQKESRSYTKIVTLWKITFNIPS